MDKGKLKTVILNPVLGILPYALLILLYLCGVSLIVSASIAICVEIANIIGATILRYKVFRLANLLSLIASLPIFVMGVFFKDVMPSDINCFLIGEVFFAIGILLINFFRTFFKQYIRSLYKTAKKDKLFIYDYFYTIDILRFFIALHILLSFFSLQFSYKTRNLTIEKLIYLAIPLTIILVAYIYQIIRLNDLYSKLKREHWLPIIDDHGNLIGKVQKNISFSQKNKNMHPVLRVLLIKDNNIYLQKRLNYFNDPFDLGTFDYPLEKYIEYGDDAEITLDKMIKGIKCLESRPKFLFDYQFINEETNRKMYIYTLEIKSDSQLDFNRFHGKFWSLKQIDEQFNDNIFSEFFEMEYEYVKNTLFAKDKNVITHE